MPGRFCGSPWGRTNSAGSASFSRSVNIAVNCPVNNGSRGRFVSVYAGAMHSGIAYMRLRSVA